MPNMVNIEPNPDFKPEDAGQKKAYDEVKKRGTVKNVSEITALENTQRSGGMYRIQRIATAPADQVTAPTIDDMGRNELIVMAASLGVKIEKGTTQADLRAAVKGSLADFRLADDPEE